MNHPMSPSEELEILLSALCDGQIREEQLARLNELLRLDEQLRRRYVHYMGLHTALQSQIAEVDPVRPPAIPGPPGSPLGPSEGDRAPTPPSATPAVGAPPVRSRTPRLAAIAVRGRAARADLRLASLVARAQLAAPAFRAVADHEGFRPTLRRGRRRPRTCRIGPSPRAWDGVPARAVKKSPS